MFLVLAPRPLVFHAARTMKKTFSILSWITVALLGAAAYLVLSFKRHEPVNSAYILVAALCTYAIGYRFYSKWIAARVLMLNDRRATPCEVHDPVCRG